MEYNRILEYCTSDVNYIIKKFNLNYISNEDKEDIIQCSCLDCIKYNDTEGKILNKKGVNYIVRRTMFSGVSQDVFDEMRNGTYVPKNTKKETIELNGKDSYNI